jgi:gamma-glutamylcyclotransferase (GGCT)/AIG2-like uncharacterized protein YtfP
LSASELILCGGAEPGLLFAYGTLVPRSAEELAQGGWLKDRVRGRLFDLGPYPGLLDAGNPSAGWVEGHVRPVSARELRDHLDPYEGVDEGLYSRVAVETESGRRVWLYQYAQPLPPAARGPLARWEGPRQSGT